MGISRGGSRRTVASPRALWPAILAVVFALALVDLPFAGAAPESGACPPVVGKTWQRIPEPPGLRLKFLRHFPNEACRLIGVSADEKVTTSQDGGVTWAAPVALPGGGTTTGIVTRGLHWGHVYLTRTIAIGTPAIAATAPAGLLASEDYGKTFAPVTEFAGVDVVGLVGARSDPSRLYAVGTPLRAPLPTSALLFRSTDSGNRWQPLPTSASIAPTQVVVDALNPDVVWVAGNGDGAQLGPGVWLSTDGGVTLDPAQPGVAADLASSSLPDRTPRIDLALPQGVVRSDDGGATFYTALGFSGISSLAVDPDFPAAMTFVAGEVAYLSDDDGKTTVAGGGVDARGCTADVSYAETWGLFQLSLSDCDRQGHYLVRLNPGVASIGDGVEPGQSGDNSCEGLVPPLLPGFPANPPPLGNRPGDTKLAPPRTIVKLGPGQTTEVPYTLNLPPNPTPLDVYFLLDTTGSMGQAICGVRNGMQQIAADLTSTGIDVGLGVGEYKDYGSAGGGDYAYKRHREIGPADQDFSNKLAGLRAGGGGDQPEAALAGLYQAVTGEGQDVEPPGASPADIAPDMGAEFRPHSLPVIINVTDAPFHVGPGYPGPTFEDTSLELQKRGVLQIGIAVSESARPDLERMASETGALAPPGGVDCDDDGNTDLQAGQPLVCSMDGLAALGLDGVSVIKPDLARPILEMLAALNDIHDIDLRADSERVVAGVEPRLRPDVDLKVGGVLGFEVAFHCPRTAGGFKQEVPITATSEGRPLADASARVVCRPEEVPPIIPRIVPPIFFAIIPPNPVIAGNPGTAPNPQPNPQPNPNPQGQAQVQSGLATQEQEQPQLALAYSAHQGMPVEELAMSKIRSKDDDDPGPGFLYLSAAGLALASLELARRRNRTSTKPAFVTNRHRSRWR